MKKDNIYIKMCKKAREIQKLAKVEDGSWFFCECKDIKNYPHGYGLNLGSESDADNGNEKLIDSSTDTWLPSQEQLQEIYGEDLFKICTSFSEFCMSSYVMKSTKQPGSKPLAMYVFKNTNQLWLAFVMKEKFNKIWKDKEWIINQ